jgi:hypothetical protein
MKPALDTPRRNHGGGSMEGFIFLEKEVED